MTVEVKMKTDERKTTTGAIELACRNCKSSLSRIPRSGFVKFILFGMPLKKYICYKCSRKTYRWVSTK